MSGRIMKGNKNSNWKGGRVKTSDGYTILHRPNHPYCTRQGYVPEHRIIVEQQIGRLLTKIEEVHHLGKRNDNKPSMLMAFVDSKAHRRFEYGVEIEISEIVYDGRKK